jgi:hypothetical protein
MAMRPYGSTSRLREFPTRNRRPAKPTRTSQVGMTQPLEGRCVFLAPPPASILFRAFSACRKKEGQSSDPGPRPISANIGSAGVVAHPHSRFPPLGRYPRKILRLQIIAKSWPTARHPCTQTKSAGSQHNRQLHLDR